MKGEFENRLRQLIEEVQASPKPIILFIDEAHTLIGAGGTAGQGDAANLLKPPLARGTLLTIAATTWVEREDQVEYKVIPSPDGFAKALRQPLLKVFPAAFLGRLVVIPY
jgi:ATP-dependent Clp protease ATP-binding subunit ClpA